MSDRKRKFLTVDAFRNHAVSELKEAGCERMDLVGGISDVSGSPLAVRSALGGGFSKMVDDDSRILEFIISTNKVDRDGDTISVDGWELDDFNRSGSVLWAHDARQLPVAKPTSTFVEAGSLKSRAQFPERDVYPFADTVYRLLVGGYLRGSSVGFKPLDVEVDSERVDPMGLPGLNFRRQELLEWSVTPVPSNTDAVVQARSAGIDTSPLADWAETLLDSSKGAETWVEKLRSDSMGRPVSVTVPEDIGNQKQVEEKQEPESDEGPDVSDSMSEVLSLLSKIDQSLNELKPAPVDADAGDDSEFLLELEDDSKSSEPQGLDLRGDDLSSLIRSVVTEEIRKAAGRLD